MMVELIIRVDQKKAVKKRDSYGTSSKLAHEKADKLVAFLKADIMMDGRSWQSRL